MQALREYVILAMIESGKVNRPSAVNYEKAIYNMCARMDDGDVSSKTYVQVAYDKVGQIIAAPGKKERGEILTDIREDVESWDSSVYVEQLTNYNATMDRSVLKPKAIKGAYKCKDKECGSDEFYVWSEQRRSSDEGATIMRQCAKCGKRGKE